MTTEPIPQKNIVVLYHGNCPDGFGAAYTAWKKFGDATDYLPVLHGNPPPENLSGKEIYIVDFSYPKEILLALEASAKKLVVLDHHISAKESVEATKEHVFDLDHSGAAIAWTYFHPTLPLPRLLAHIEDNDLWRHSLPNGKEIGAYLGTVPFTFEAFEIAAIQLEDEAGLAAIISKGSAYSEYYDYICNSFVAQAEEVQFGEFSVLAVNASGLFKSEIGNRLAKQKGPFAIVWSGREGLWHCSLRGDGSVDVSEIAKHYGGGGHHNAASFRISMTQPLPFIVTQK